MAPEEKARLGIDKKLIQAGWQVQDLQEINLNAGLGVAVREYPTDSGEVDYALFVEGKPCGIIEAKRAEEGHRLSVHETQSDRYAESKFKYIKRDVDIRFVYEATDKIIHFTDYKDIDYRPREVFNFFRPETLQVLLQKEDTIRNNLREMPDFDKAGFRKCQIDAVENLDKSLAHNRPYALIQMATGAGKTFTAITAVYRMLKFGKFNRILFLVDTKSLAEQAENEFNAYMPNDDRRPFTQIYGVHRLKHSSMPKDCQVYISTIQRMYSMLRGEDPDDSVDEESCGTIQGKGNRDVVYNAKYPPEYFDCIIVDECHRSIYDVWSQVLKYFDAFIIGLTATPSAKTIAFFNQNLVSEYTREQATIDGVNVGEDIYLIETDITNNGAHIEAKQLIERRNRLTREKRYEELPEDVDYIGKDLDKSVVNKSTIRAIIRKFKEAVETTLFPERQELPKTLIFAKDDSHAEDIVNIVREEFDKGREFCKKITYNASDANVSLKSFRNDFYPRVAVTVNMIATGTDVKPIECLVFLRDIHSKIYFEQMKGRGTRTLKLAELQKVSPSAKENKDHFVIIDAVGVTKSKKVETRTLERKPSVSLKDLMMSVAMGTRDDDTLTSLANRLIRLNAKLDKDEQKEFVKVAGSSPNILTENLLNAFDEDYICEKAGIFREKDRDFTDDEFVKFNAKQQELAEKAAAPFCNPEIRKHIEHLKTVHDQIIDSVNLDTVTFAGFDVQKADKAEEMLASFRTYINEHKDELIALNIIYDQDYKNRRMTIKKLEELYEGLKKQGITVARLWDCYATLQPEKVKRSGTVARLADLVSMVRFELGYADNLEPFADRVNYNFMKWSLDFNAKHAPATVTEEQQEWLRLIRDYIVVSLSIDREDLDMNPFSQKGGLGKFYELFGGEYEEILNELNEKLVA